MAASEITAGIGPAEPRCEECSAPMARSQRYCLECGARRGPLPGRIAHTLGAALEQGSAFGASAEGRSKPTEAAGAAAGGATAGEELAGTDGAAEAQAPGAEGEGAAGAEGERAAGAEGEHGEAKDGDGAEPDRAADEDPSSTRQHGVWRKPIGPGLPTPGAAALAVMGMLAFGVIVGALSRGGVAALASLPQVVLNLPGGGSSSQDTGGSAAGGTSSQAAAPAASADNSAPASDTGAAASAAAASGSGSAGNTGGLGGVLTPTGNSGLPPVGHLFLIVLSQQGYAQTFGPGSPDSYLSKTLTSQGKILINYYAVAGSPLANRIALLSGQGPTQQTAAGCSAYTPIAATGTGADGQVLGNGCVYPDTTDTLGGQLAAKAKTWRAYIEGIGTGQAPPCSHPMLGAADTSSPSPTQPYAVSSNPFMYFQSVINSPACAKNNVGLDQLKADLKTKATTPTLSYIAPSPCHDGRDQPCAPGAPAGLGQADQFLQSVLPEIESSPAYKADGMIAITFDQAPQTGPQADPSSCCGNPTYPNVPAASTPAPAPGGTTTTTSTTPTTTTTTPTTTPTSTTPTTTTPTGSAPSNSSGQTSPTGGGGQVGLLLISRYVAKGTNDTLDYFNHFSLLAGLEKIFGLSSLGYAGAQGLPVWTSSVFSGTGL